MPEFLEFSVDKFSFMVATDRLYSPEGLWARAESSTVRIGLSDYLQQRSGDIAFVEVKAEGKTLAAGDEIATIETNKVNIALSSPVTGKVVRLNPQVESAPEIINQDPYGEGWLVVIEVVDWETTKARLMGPEAYLAHVGEQAEAEVNSP